MLKTKTFVLTAIAAAVAAAAFTAAASDKAPASHGSAKVEQPLASLNTASVAASHDKPGAAHAKHAVHWSYEGEGGPAEWGRLDADSAKCYLGRAQSPVNIANAVPKKLSPITFKYQPGTLDVVNNGHTVQFNYPAGSSMEVQGKRYELLQFHFHAPSEHAINGKRYPLEFHFVHKNSDGKLAVVGVMVAPGAASEAYRPLLDNLPMAGGEERRNKKIQYNAATLLPKNQAYVAYSGSLTTPPCSEEVAWHVMTTPVSLSEAQVGRIKQTYSANSRPLQKLHGRELAAAGK